MTRDYPRIELLWMRKERNKSIEEYMFHQREEMKSITTMVEGFFDGWPIKDWDFYWDRERDCWTIDVYPDQDDISPMEYFYNKGAQN